MIGEVVAQRYRIVARIGAGGGGDVFEAEDLELPRRVALKFLSPVLGDNPRVRERFFREAQALSALDHPHICTIYETGETEAGRLFIAMAYYEGSDLKARLAHGALEITEALSWGISIADGMDKAHRKGFVHRDLKPGNIVITEDGVVKILDFGLALLPDRTQMTETGTTMGTLAYASPEQARGEKVTARSDIYSLGVILYQMVTGVCPFTGSTAAATLQMVFGKQVVAPRKLRSGVPRALDGLIRRCMDRDPERRPGDMAEVRNALLDVLGSISPSEAAMQRAQHVELGDQVSVMERMKRRRLLILALVVLVIGVVGWKFKDYFIPPSAQNNRGVAILPFQVEGDEERLRRVAAGLWLDLSEQATRIADVTPQRWILPVELASGAGISTAAFSHGVEKMVAGSLALGEDAYVVELRVIDGDGERVSQQESWELTADDAQSEEILVWLANALDVGLSERRIAQFTQGMPRSWIAYETYLQGLGALQEGATGEAVESLRRALAADPEYPMTRLRWAQAMTAHAVNEPDGMWLDRADSTLLAEPRPLAYPAMTYALMAGVAERRDDSVGAARLLKLALEHAPYNPQYRRSLWFQWYSQGDMAGVDGVTRKGIDLNPGYYGTHEDRGFFFYLSNRLVEAVDSYKQTVDLAPGNSNAFNTMGACLLKLERFDEATKMFETSFGLERTLRASSNLGTLYYMQEKFALAADMFEFAEQYNPDNYVIVGNRAAALHWIPERREEALALLRRGVVLVEKMLVDDPSDLQALAYLSSYLVHLDPERSLRLAEESLARRPENPDVLLQIAVTFEELGKRTRALGVLADALKEGLPEGQVMNEPLLKELRGDPRFHLLMP